MSQNYSETSILLCYNKQDAFICSAEEESAQLQPQPHQYSGVAVSPGRPCLPASPPGWIIKVGVSNSLEWIDCSGEREGEREEEERETETQLDR